MSFKDNKTEIETILKDIFKEKKEFIKKTNDLYSYIDPDFFDSTYEDDKVVSENIEKRVHVIKKIILEKVKKLEDNEIQIEYYSSKLMHENYEPILFLYTNETEKKQNFKKIPTQIDDKNNFFIIIDFINGFKLLPWS